jgi:trimethylamine--corrinoid protein Co-methyltransferase
MSAVTPPLAPIRSVRRLRLLDDGQLADLRAATLEILETVGIHVPSGRVRRLYEDHGATVDHGSRIVRLPPDLVLAAMARAPRSYTLGARTVGWDLLLDGSAFYVGTDGSGIRVVDRVTGQVRPSTVADVADMARVADALPALGFYWPIVSASDHPATAPLHELLASYSNTVKHVQTETVMGATQARHAVDMARVLAGSESVMRSRPPLSSLICAISPLAQDDEGMEAALVFAAAGVPVGLMSMANCGTTGPATIAGTLVQGDAEIIAALVLIQLVHPGAPVFHSLMTGVMNPRTGGFLTTSMSGEVAYGAGVEMAHAWGVPTLAGVFGTDAPEPGWQVAAESAVNLTMCGLLGAETGSGMGLLDACTVLHHEQIVLDADLHERVRVNLAGLDTSPAALAMDIIREVGPRGHFLHQPHTRDGLRAMRFSAVTGRSTPDGTPIPPRDVALATVDRLLREHRPEPLDERAAAELARIVATADREVGAGPHG